MVYVRLPAVSDGTVDHPVTHFFATVALFVHTWAVNLDDHTLIVALCCEVQASTDTGHACKSMHPAKRVDHHCGSHSRET